MTCNTSPITAPTRDHHWPTLCRRMVGRPRLLRPPHAAAPPPAGPQRIVAWGAPPPATSTGSPHGHPPTSAAAWAPALAAAAASARCSASSSRSTLWRASSRSLLAAVLSATSCDTCRAARGWGLRGGWGAGHVNGTGRGARHMACRPPPQAAGVLAHFLGQGARSVCMRRQGAAAPMLRAARASSTPVGRFHHWRHWRPCLIPQASG